MKFSIIDSHCHLDFPELSGRTDEILHRMHENSVSHALCISVNLSGFKDVLKLALDYPNLYASVGIHPDQPPGTPGADADVEHLCRLAAHDRVLGIGETGLDYHWHKDAPEWQRHRFRIHIQAANLCRKPLVIHTRAAAADTLSIMKQENASEAGGVMHCFTETREVAQAALDLGFYISFSGIITFKNAGELREVVRYVPLDRLLVETDAPYLAPVPHRGKTNEPAFVLHVVDEVAKCKGITVAEVARETSRNFQELFRVKLNS